MVVDFTREVYTLNDMFLCMISRDNIPFLVEYHFSLPVSYFVVISSRGFVSANFGEKIPKKMNLKQTTRINLMIKKAAEKKKKKERKRT